MIRVRFKEGLAVQGETYEDIVRGMMEESTTVKPSVTNFMEEMKTTVQQETGNSIHFNDSESFIKELQRLDLITSMETDQQ
ncbi:hypothetical protein H1S01_04110 [Heliobacterium chlorum]|uniref:Uncharacterized protein n=1 Tax=Heliobacterium chlorum TaxID=2698 RepID=A0ABR7SYT1_HELCL|nr:hypothetical protein [Heliobacterium chlorum]MBC9783695.1 hypothetical protein [Heliobacterium chlorum]